MNDIKDTGKAGRYAALKTRLFLADLILSAIWIVLFQLLFSRGLADAAGELAGSFYLSCVIYGSAFMAYMYTLSFPVHFYASYTVEHSFGLSSQGLTGWFKDEIKGVTLSYVLSLGCLLGFYLILRTFNAYWWAIAGTVWVFFTVVLARLFPVIIIPLFYKYLPLGDDALKAKILDLAEKTGIGVMDVCRIDMSRKTKKANAAIVGIGATKRVILSDTLAEAFDHDEALAVIAHEFGHHRHGHIRKLLAFSAVVTYSGFYLLYIVLEKIAAVSGARGIDDLYMLPVLILLMSVFGLALLPLQNFFSRVLEREADAFALEHSSGVATFVSVMEKLARMNLAEREPSLIKKIFFYDHPPINERIRYAESRPK